MIKLYKVAKKKKIEKKTELCCNNNWLGFPYNWINFGLSTKMKFNQSIYLCYIAMGISERQGNENGTYQNVSYFIRLEYPWQKLIQIFFCIWCIR